MSIVRNSQSPAQPSSASGISRDQANNDEEISKRDFQTILGASAGGLSALFLIAWLLLPLSSKILPFIVVSAWPLLTLIVVAYQAIVYRRQWNAMQAQREIMNEQLQLERSKANPRLQITDVRVINFRADESPIFLVSIKNVGATDAENVVIDLRASFGHPVSDEGTLAQALIEPQTITVPAGQEHTYPIPWDGPITQEHIDRFSKRLRVSGFIQLKGEEKREFCYRYYPIKGQRPEGMAEFFPCDFDTRLKKIVTPAAARLKLTAHPPDVIVKPSPPKDVEPKDKSNADGKDKGEN